MSYNVNLSDSDKERLEYFADVLDTDVKGVLRHGLMFVALYIQCLERPEDESAIMLKENGSLREIVVS